VPDRSRSRAPATAAALARRRDELHRQQGVAQERVGALLASQQQLSQGLKAELGSLDRAGHSLDELEARAQQGGLLAALTRQLNRRRSTLARRSATEGLTTRYQAVSARLRAAAAFCDELQLAALQLQAELDDLHEDAQAGHAEEQRAARQIQALEAELVQLEALASTEAERRIDRLRFQVRSEGANLELALARVRLAQQYVEPTRQLRDTLQRLHADMSRFLVAATASVQAAGRRIQALGMVADAPMVVDELQSSMQDLASAIAATEQQIAQSQRLLVQVLPTLARELEADGALEEQALRDNLERLDRDRARALAEQALREEAEREVEALGRRL